MSLMLMVLPIPSVMIRHHMALTNCRPSMHLPTSLPRMSVFLTEITPKIILGISLLPLVPLFCSTCLIVCSMCFGSDPALLDCPCIGAIDILVSGSQ